MLEISILMTLLCQCNPNSYIQWMWQTQTLKCINVTIQDNPIIQFILQSKEFIAMLASAAVPICKKKWSKESVVPKCVKL